MEPIPDNRRVSSSGRQGSSSPRSANKSAKSGTSGKNSISVVLPHASGDESPVQIRSISGGNGIPGRKDQHTSAQRSLSPRSVGTVPPQSTPQPVLSQNEIRRIVATRIIESAWMSFRDRQMFKLLKHAVCAAEHSLSYEILRKVAPKEAELLKDKSTPCKVRFRFGGPEYPPMIFFKIYVSSKTTGGMGVRYVSGKKMIKPASEAARDAYEQMGARLFYDQCLQDTLQQKQHRVSSEVDVTTLKDYMHYLSLLDETPAYMGGRDNSWRKLTLEVLPRFTIFYDVVSYLYSKERAMTPRLQDELHTLLMPPLTQEVQLQHIQIISTQRPPETTYTSQASRPLSAKKRSSRRSRQAKLRVLKMRKLYEDAQKASREQSPGISLPPLFPDGEERVPDPKMPSQHMFLDEEEDDDDDWEQEADKLYEWTKELTADDMTLSYQAMSPSVPAI